MQFSQVQSCIGVKKAKKLGLTSKRFTYESMSSNALEAIEYVKLKDRSALKLNEWNNKKYSCNDATQQLFNCNDQISREDTRTLSVQEFIQKYESKNKPVVIKGCAKDWNIGQNWTFQSIYQQHKDKRFKVGQDDDGYKLRMPLRYYFQYLVYNQDDSPLYMFESQLDQKKQFQSILQNYTVPIYFKDDLLKYAGQKKRPPHRWFLIGPERSGSTVHIDPLSTSAWNTSLAGHKRWVLFAEKVPKSIVKGKAYRTKNYEDEAINYFTQVLPRIRSEQNHQAIGMIQFIQHPGQTVFVPGGWWHAVINLDTTMALTQNVMTHVNFDKVWRSIRCERRKFAQYLLQCFNQKQPALKQRSLCINKIDNYDMGNKYEKQSVSMSFTGSASSSSSSSSSSNSQSFEEDKKKKNGKNLVKKRSIQRSQSFSRSREKKNKKILSEEKTVNYYEHEKI